MPLWIFRTSYGPALGPIQLALPSIYGIVRNYCSSGASQVMKPRNVLASVRSSVRNSLWCLINLKDAIRVWYCQKIEITATAGSDCFLKRVYVGMASHGQSLGLNRLVCTLYPSDEAYGIFSLSSSQIPKFFVVPDK